MEHTDEGTIHAWLDGALPADEGARIEAHVASCAACAAAVAEARGLIAASSRILSALDDVPGGVIPVTVVTAESITAQETEQTLGAASTVSLPAEIAAGREVVASGSASRAPRAAGRRARRPWYLRPQWAAAAGITFLAVAATAVWQKSGRSSVTDAASERMATAPMAAEPMAAAPAPDVAADAAAPKASGAVTADAPSRATPTPAARQERDDARSRAEASSSNEMKKEAGAGAAEGMARREVPLVASKSVVAKDSTARPIPVPAAPPPAVAARESSARRVSDSMAGNRVLAINADAITQSDSARLAGELRVRRSAANLTLQNATVTGASSSATAQRTQAAAMEKAGVAPSATPAALAGCYRVLPADVARAAGVDGILQLDFAAAGSDEARPAYAARDLGAATAQPLAARALLRWTLSTSGDVVLVRGEGATAQRVTLRTGALGTDSLAAGQLQATRTTCPVR